MSATVLCIDTETTGLPLDGAEATDPRQPHLVELGAALYDAGADRIRARLSLIVRPDGWTIPDDVARLHGISTEIAGRCGVPLDAALAAFASIAASAGMVIAYNAPFDRHILAMAWRRGGRGIDGFARLWPADAPCIMARCTPILDLPPSPRMVAAGIGGPKPPRLTEAYNHFFGEPLAGAHSALTDCLAALRIWRELERREREAAR